MKSDDEELTEMATDRLLARAEYLRDAIADRQNELDDVEAEIEQREAA